MSQPCEAVLRTGRQRLPENDPTLLANLPDWLKAAPMRENLLASWRQSGQKQDPCPSLLNHNANTSGFCRLVVISPTVSGRLLDMTQQCKILLCDRPYWGECGEPFAPPG